MTPTRPGPEAMSAPDPEARVVCPWCQGDATERLSDWGPFLSVARYYCRTCRTVFDVLRDAESGD